MPTVIRKTVLRALVLLVSALALSATEAVVTRNANLRNDPSSKHAPQRQLQADDEVELLNSEPTDGYYQVKTDDGHTGWIWGKSLRILSDGDSGPAPTPGTPASGVALAPGTPAGTIPKNWEKPDPETGTFDGSEGACGPSGDGGDEKTNLRKNRTDVPSSYHAITWKALATLAYPVAGKSLADWSQGQLDQITPYEGIAVQTVGYLVAIKPQNKGSGESTNCHFTSASDTDWHMALVEHAGDGEATSVVVETTPRIRASHPNWTPKALAPWVNQDAQVRISGWVLIDPEHRNHLNKYRSTLWEIHPITKIEVSKDGAWIDLDEVP
jgi:Bacterial SH3 domain